MEKSALGVMKGCATILRPAELDDAPSIISFRNDASIRRFLSTSPELTVQMQHEWMNRNPFGSGNLYFVITDLQGNFCGTIALYNIKNGTAEFGRYICTKTLQAIESEKLILDLAFGQCGLLYLYCRTAFDNEAVWRQHYRYGFEDVGLEEDASLPFSLKVQGISREMYKNHDFSKIESLINRFQR
jgi:RimJ/RimL family protein N-acetyltransferase